MRHSEIEQSRETEFNRAKQRDRVRQSKAERDGKRQSKAERDGKRQSEAE